MERMQRTMMTSERMISAYLLAARVYSVKASTVSLLSNGHIYSNNIT